MPASFWKVTCCLRPGRSSWKRDREAAVEERHHLQALHDGRGAELDLLEHRRVGPEGDRRTRVPALRCGDRPQLALRNSRLHRAARLRLGRVLLAVRVTVTVDFEHEPRRQRVHHRHARRRAIRPTPCSRRRRTCRPRAAWSSRPRPPTGPCTAGARRPGCRARCRPRCTPPSARSVTSTRVQWPAIASSIALSTTSHTRWCKPDGPVEPMYMPGRLRTGSSPSSTWMCSAEYPPLADLPTSRFLAGAMGPR